MSSSVYIGIDVAKAQLDVACRPTDARWTIAHTARGIAQLVRRLGRLRPTLIVLEATVSSGAYKMQDLRIDAFRGAGHLFL